MSSPVTVDSYLQCYQFDEKVLNRVNKKIGTFVDTLKEQYPEFKATLTIDAKTRTEYSLCFSWGYRADLCPTPNEFSKIRDTVLKKFKATARHETNPRYFSLVVGYYNG